LGKLIELAQRNQPAHRGARIEPLLDRLVLIHHVVSVRLDIDRTHG